MTSRFGFAFCLQPGNQDGYALLLCRSIRQYAGKCKEAPIFALVPDNHLSKLSSDTLTSLKSLNTEIVPFSNYVPKQQIYYAAKSIAAGAAEQHAAGRVEQLIYLDVDSIIINDPSMMFLSNRKKLGIRPVDIKNIGSVWEEQVDDFWTDIYKFLRVDEHKIFPVISTVDSIKLRAYLNACFLTVKPENGLLQKWSSNFVRLSENPVWTSFFNQSEFYRIFLHQAIMVGTFLTELSEEEFEIYPVQVNFPLNFYPRHPHKPEWINELITCRLDMLDADECWKNWLPMREPLKSWLISQYKELKLEME